MPGPVGVLHSVYACDPSVIEHRCFTCVLFVKVLCPVATAGSDALHVSYIDITSDFCG